MSLTSHALGQCRVVDLRCACWSLQVRKITHWRNPSLAHVNLEVFSFLKWVKSVALVVAGRSHRVIQLLVPPISLWNKLVRLAVALAVLLSCFGIFARFGQRHRRLFHDRLHHVVQLLFFCFFRLHAWFLSVFSENGHWVMRLRFTRIVVLRWGSLLCWTSEQKVLIRSHSCNFSWNAHRAQIFFVKISHWLQRLLNRWLVILWCWSAQCLRARFTSHLASITSNSVLFGFGVVENSNLNLIV